MTNRNPKVGTGKKPKGSGRTSHLSTDEERLSCGKMWIQIFE